VALTPHEQKIFHRWIIKSLAGPLLAFLIYFTFSNQDFLVSYWPLTVLASLLFGGFPFWNLVFETERVFLFIFYFIHATVTFLPVFYLHSRYELPPPFDLVFCLLAWFFSYSALIFLMPETAQRIDDLSNWRKEKLRQLLLAHY
jgi:hypothetical protein